MTNLRKVKATMTFSVSKASGRWGPPRTLTGSVRPCGLCALELRKEGPTCD